MNKEIEAAKQRAKPSVNANRKIGADVCRKLGKDEMAALIEAGELDDLVISALDQALLDADYDMHRHNKSMKMRWADALTALVVIATILLVGYNGRIPAAALAVGVVWGFFLGWVRFRNLLRLVK